MDRKFTTVKMPYFFIRGIGKYRGFLLDIAIKKRYISWEGDKEMYGKLDRMLNIDQEGY